MKQDKVVCDICGGDVGEDHAVIVLTLHPAHGMGKKLTLDLCEQHANPAWGRLLASLQKEE